MNKFTFTDLKLLETIQKEYANDYIKNMEDANNGVRNTRFYIPIDCQKVAKKMKADGEIVFNRLYFHLNNKYSYKDMNDNPVYFFVFEIDGLKHCINYGYLCSVLADLKDKKFKENLALSFSIISIIISIMVPIITCILKQI